MKALVLARGKGTRMQRADRTAAVGAAQSSVADTGLKAMIPFRRPFLDYVLSALADAGCLDICLVIGPEHGVVRDYYERTRPPERVRLTFADPAGRPRHGGRRAFGGGVRGAGAISRAERRQLLPR